MCGDCNHDEFCPVMGTGMYPHFTYYLLTQMIGITLLPVLRSHGYDLTHDCCGKMIEIMVTRKKLHDDLRKKMVRRTTEKRMDFDSSTVDLSDLNRFVS